MKLQQCEKMYSLLEIAVKHYTQLLIQMLWATLKSLWYLLTLPHRRTFKSLLSLFAGGFLNI
jgi:hypothetical protein